MIFEQVKEDEGQLYVPDVHRYTRGKYAIMVAFTRDCEHAFAVRPLTYAAARSQVMFGIGHLTGETQNNWVRDHPSPADVPAHYTRAANTMPS